MSERSFKYPSITDMHKKHLSVIQILQDSAEMRYLKFIIERGMQRRKKVNDVRSGRAKSPAYAFYYASEESIVLCSFLVYHHMLQEKPRIADIIENTQLSRPTIRQKLKEGMEGGFFDKDYMPGMEIVNLWQESARLLINDPSLMNLVDTLHNLQVYTVYRPAYYNNGKATYKPDDVVKNIFNSDENAFKHN